MKKYKILICGEARHGKDTVADLITDFLGYKSISSSVFVGKILYETVLKEKYNYKSFEECFEDRVTKREEWYNLICEYNANDKARAAKGILEVADIYVGMRDDEEFHASKDLFDIRIWVDASDRKPQEGSGSNKLNKNMFNVTINNNGTLDDLVENVRVFCSILNN